MIALSQFNSLSGDEAGGFFADPRMGAERRVQIVLSPVAHRFPGDLQQRFTVMKDWRRPCGRGMPATKPALAGCF
jgi:hypothetical protein